ncbi:hypothetical protein TNCV_3408971 [Trichonephila clavipes]|nr:hypothetical protein TNCV_3408971 [Trichonephila clavipes]
MSVQSFLKLEEVLKLLNSLDSDESDLQIAVLSPDTIELTDEGEGEENEVNTGEIIVKYISGFLEVRTGNSFRPEELLCFDNKEQKQSLKTSVILDKE